MHPANAVQPPLCFWPNVHDMRKPTPQDGLYDWHRAALAGRNPPIHEGDPHVGWYKRRFVRNGPWVAGRIWLHSEVDDSGELVADEALRCEIGGKEFDPIEVWSFLAAHPISRQEYEYMTADRQWAQVNAPDDPSANENVKLDFNKIPLPF